MSYSQDKIESLLSSSREVLLSCCLDNGAIVAANTDMPYYPKNANDYRYVWPRDAAFILYALEILGEKQTGNFARWLIERAEGFVEEGLFCRRYATNGSTSYPQNELQPDQAGTLLWSFCSSSESHTQSVQVAIKAMADHIASNWQQQNFSKETYDLWEHHHNKPGEGQFTYTLASCIYGLRQASAVYLQPDPQWLVTAELMQNLLIISDEFYTATIDEDFRLDASLYGLAWPFRVTNDSNKLLLTMNKIRASLGRPSGIMRFSNDTYDGLVHDGKDDNRGAGTWPLLSFWEIMAYQALGKPEIALKLFDSFIERLPDDFIPEQQFYDGRQGVSPLGWAHAMFIIVSKELGLMDYRATYGSPVQEVIY